MIYNQPWGLLQKSFTNAPYWCIDSTVNSPQGLLKKANEMNTPTYQLTFDDAVDIWKRHWRGEFQHRIAAHFDVNPGCVNEVLKESRHVGSREAALTGKSA